MKERARDHPPVQGKYESPLETAPFLVAGDQVAEDPDDCGSDRFGQQRLTG